MQVFQGKGELDALFHRFAHADDTAATDVHAHVAGGLQGVEFFLLGVCATEMGEVGGSGLQVAMVAGDAGIV